MNSFGNSAPQNNNESIGMKGRKDAVKTLKEALENPHSDTAVNIKRAHALITLLREQMEKEGINTEEELIRVHEIKKELEMQDKLKKQKSANEEKFGGEQAA